MADSFSFFVLSGGGGRRGRAAAEPWGQLRRRRACNTTVGGERTPYSLPPRARARRARRRLRRAERPARAAWGAQRLLAAVAISFSWNCCSQILVRGDDGGRRIGAIDDDDVGGRRRCASYGVIDKPDRLTHYRATSSKSETRVGASKCAATITRSPALASSRHPRPTPMARALPSGLVARRGQNWTPIRGQICAPIDDLPSSGDLLGRPPGFVASTAPCPGRRPGCRGAHDFV